MRSMIDLCFMCSNEKKCNILDNKIVTQVEYLMPEITIIKLRVPLRFCSVCEQNLNLFSTFKKDCLENSLRLEAWIKEKYDTNINTIEEVYIKEEVLDKSDKPEVKYSFEDEIYIKDDPLPDNPSGCEFDEKILKEETPPQTDMDDKSDKNSDDPNDLGIKFDESILITDSTGRQICTCLICKKSFKKLSYLKCHMKIHTGTKDFQCNDCKKMFLHKSNLVVHMKQHTGKKDYQCNECQKWFLYRSNLIAHMKQHNGKKDYQCKECKKWFLYKSNFTKHVKKHTRVKDFQCT